MYCSTPYVRTIFNLCELVFVFLWRSCLLLVVVMASYSSIHVPVRLTVGTHNNKKYKKVRHVRHYVIFSFSLLKLLMDDDRAFLFAVMENGILAFQGYS